MSEQRTVDIPDRLRQFDWEAIARRCEAFLRVYRDRDADATILGSALGRLWTGSRVYEWIEATDRAARIDELKKLIAEMKTWKPAATLAVVEGWCIDQIIELELEAQRDD